MPLTEPSRPSRGGESPDESLVRAVVSNAAVQTLLVMVAVSMVGWGVAPQGVGREFVFEPPVTEPWYEPLFSTYAHGDTDHLLANATTIGVVGGLVSLSAARWRFHLFFVITGITSSVVQVVVMDATGTAPGVIGASGAGFALVGYLLVANPVSLPALRSLSGRGLLVVIGGGAAILTLWMSPEGSALLSHFTGLILGCLAGLVRLLEPRRGG